MLSSFTKWNHHKAIYLGCISSATHRNTFMSWDPLLHPQFLVRIYIKYHFLKNISTISMKLQLMAFSVMILNIPYISISLRIYAPKTLKPMDEIVYAYPIWQQSHAPPSFLLSPGFQEAQY